MKGRRTDGAELLDVRESREETASPSEILEEDECKEILVVPSSDWPKQLSMSRELGRREGMVDVTEELGAFGVVCPSERGISARGREDCLTLRLAEVFRKEVIFDLPKG
jgi:hypothetical protein